MVRCPSYRRKAPIAASFERPSTPSCGGPSPLCDALVWAQPVVVEVGGFGVVVVGGSVVVVVELDVGAGGVVVVVVDCWGGGVSSSVVVVVVPSGLVTVVTRRLGVVVVVVSSVVVVVVAVVVSVVAGADVFVVVTSVLRDTTSSRGVCLAGAAPSDDAPAMEAMDAKIVATSTPDAASSTLGDTRGRRRSGSGLS